MGVVEAIVASAVVGAAGSIYTAKKQEEAAEEAQRYQEELADEAKARQLQEGENQALSETATTKYGVDDSLKKKQTSSDLLIPRQTNISSVGSNSERTGLGF